MSDPLAPCWSRRGGVLLAAVGTAQLGLTVAISGGRLADGVEGAVLSRLDLAAPLLVAVATFLLVRPWLAGETASTRSWWWTVAAPLWGAWLAVVVFAAGALTPRPHTKDVVLSALFFRSGGATVRGLAVGPLLLTIAIVAVLAPSTAAFVRRAGAVRTGAVLVANGLVVRIAIAATHHTTLDGPLSWPFAHLHLVGAGLLAAGLLHRWTEQPPMRPLARLRWAAAAVGAAAFALAALGLGLPRSPLLGTVWQVTASAVIAVVLGLAVLVATFIGAGDIHADRDMESGDDTLPARRRLATALAVTAPGIVLGGDAAFRLLAVRYRERVVVFHGGVFLRGNVVAPFIWSFITAAMLGVLISALVWSGVQIGVRRRLPHPSASILFAAVVAIGWFVRLGAMLRLAPEKTDVGDPLFYHTTANLLARGRGFFEPLNWIAYQAQRPSALHGPLYPLVLSISSRFGGTSYFDQKLMSILIGTAVVAVAGLLARELAGDRVGLMAASLAAVYPNLWLIDGLLFPEGLMALLVTTCILLAYRWRARPTMARAALLGAAIALAALTRGEGLLLLPLLAAPLMWRRLTLDRRTRLRQLGVATVACVAVLAPWMIHNVITFKDFVPLSTNGNELLVYSNCDAAYHGKFAGYWDFGCEERIHAAGGGPDLSKLDESQTANFWKRVGLTYAKDHARDVPRVVTLRVLRQWELFRPTQNVDFATSEGRNRTAGFAGLFMYYLLCIGSVGGAVHLRRRRVPLLPLVVPFVVVTVTAAYTYGNIRFRASVEPALCVMAAVSLVPLLGRFRRWFLRPDAEAHPSTDLATTLVAEPTQEPVHEPAPFVQGGRGGLRVRVGGAWQRAAITTWCALGAVLAVVAIPLRGLYHTTGGTMEEAFMIVFPERMTKGDLPNRDFLHLYGPGALHVLMGWYALVGRSLEAERTFGLLQHLGIIVALFVLARPWGRWAAAAVAGLAAFYVLTPIGLTAMAWNGGLALCLWSIVFALRSRQVARPTRCLVAAGVLAGLALTYRPDLGLALVLVYVWFLWRRRDWRAVAIGVVVGLLPIWVHVAMVGVGRAFQGMVMDPVFHLRAGRALPRPPSFSRLDGSLQAIAELVPPWWKIPHLSAAKELFLWFFAALAAPLVLLWLARRASRREPASHHATVLTAVGLFSLGIVPQALQRPDSTHLSWVSCISFPFLVVGVMQWMLHRRTRLGTRQQALVGAAAVVALTLTVAPLFTFRYYLLHTRVSVGQVQTPFPVSRHGRRFYLGDYGPYLASRDVIHDLDRLSHPGERLLVGPLDLRRTWYSDDFFYYLFPELTPATYFIEMDPGLANAPGSRLSSDVASADWVVLTGFWAGWQEPNSSMDFGSDAPNEVIRTKFCEVGSYQQGLVKLYHRCHP